MHKKIQMFIELFAYWCGRFNLPLIEIRQDNRNDCQCMIVEYTDKSTILYYNTKELLRFTNSVIVGAVFHEIGHLINNLPYKTIDQQIESEYKAELFSVRMIKKYYPKYYSQFCKHMKKKLSTKAYEKKHMVHYLAFSRIKDFQ